MEEEEATMPRRTSATAVILPSWLGRNEEDANRY
jgi:hypothetical protein